MFLTLSNLTLLVMLPHPPDVIHLTRHQVLVMAFSVDDLVEMASGACGPALPAYWRALALYNVSQELCSRAGTGVYSSKVSGNGVCSSMVSEFLMTSRQILNKSCLFFPRGPS